MSHYLATGDGPVLNKRIEIAALHADGTEFPVELAITPILTDGAILFTATLRDISERRRVERELVTAHEELEARVETRTRELSEALQERRSIMETVPDILFRLDLHGKNRPVEPEAGDGDGAYNR